MDNVKRLSGTDLIKYMNGDAKIILYDQLQTYDSIDGVFWDSPNVFLLYPVQSRNSGHWCALRKRGYRKIEIFDSYGIFVDEEEEHGAMPYEKYLSQLLIKSPKDIKLYYNEIPFQKMNAETCGYHCISFFKHNMPMKQYQQFLLKKEDPDKYVYNYVMNLN